MTWYIEPDADDYESADRLFEWEIPEKYNIAWDLLRKHEDPKGKIALIQKRDDGTPVIYSYHDLDVLSNRVANSLEERGVEFGDRVAIMVPQKAEYLLAQFACWKVGAISVPIPVLFGDNALEYRLQDSEATALFIDESVTDVLPKIDSIQENCPALEHVVGVGTEHDLELDFEELLSAPPQYTIADTSKDTPAIILYTSGTTGNPKGVLHTHDIWAGHAPGLYMWYNCDIDESVFWTPAEWSWIGTMAGMVCPAMHYGRPIVGYPMEEFDPETAFSILEEFSITDTFLAPTAIRMMMDVENPGENYDLDVDTIASGGEVVTSDIHRWAENELSGTTINEAYGRTEGTMLVCNCQSWFDTKPGSMGRSVIGHEVAIVDSETGEEKPPGEVGEIAVKRGSDPALFEGYWQAPEKTAESRVGDWDLTGDLAKRDEDGYFYYISRKDDVIITSGYRVGPSEVEDAILEHEAVSQVGVIGVPDDKRGEIIKAYVKVSVGVEESDELKDDIRTLVKSNLAKHEYPREIEFVSELPKTTTGKIQRTKLRERHDGS